MREDLRALSVDDLERLSNRGTVRRAQRDLAEGRLTFDVGGDGDEVTVAWAGDGEGTCTFPAGKTVRDGRCTCVSTSMCRHLVGAVLACQQGAVSPSPSSSVSVSGSASASVSVSASVSLDAASPAWDPGGISDEQLKKTFRRLGDVGTCGLVEVVRGAKPFAHFHQIGCVVRFLVPGDARYAHCTCKKPDPCEHVPLAVQAFRLLAAGQERGFLSAGPAAPVEVAVLGLAEGVLAELAEHGLASLTSLWPDRVLRAERALREAGLVWPAEIAAELVAEYERYVAHDALFGPERLVDLAGELLIRCDAIAAAPPEVPQLLVRGGAGDRESAAAKDVYIGLGVGVMQRRRGVEVTAYLQETGSGIVVGATRAFADSEEREPAPLWELSQAYGGRSDKASGGAPLADLGRGQIVLQGGRRRPDRSLVLPRKTGGVLPQAYRWEKLQAPVLAESFEELRTRLAMLPPSSLRARHVGEDLHVLPVAAVESAGFDFTMQRVRVQVRDSVGETALVEHPFMARASEGMEALLAALRDEASRLCFVSGRVGLGAGALVVSPLAFVFERDGQRRAVLPWVDRFPDRVWMPGAGPSGTGDVILDLLQDLCERLGEVLLLGVGRVDARMLGLWRELGCRLQVAGSSALRDRVKALVEQMEQRLSVVGWTAGEAVAMVLRLCAVWRLAQDVRV